MLLCYHSRLHVAQHLFFSGLSYDGSSRRRDWDLKPNVRCVSCAQNGPRMVGLAIVLVHGTAVNETFIIAPPDLQIEDSVDAQLENVKKMVVKYSISIVFRCAWVTSTSNSSPTTSKVREDAVP